MAIFNIPGTIEVPSPTVVTPAFQDAGTETFGTPPEDVSVFIGSNVVKPFPDYSGSGTGSVRPSTGQVYPRGL